MNKIELFNARNDGHTLTEGMTFVLVDVDTFADTTKDGDPVEVVALKAESGEIYTTISGTIRSAVDDLRDILNESPVTVKVITAVSNSGRKYFRLSII